MSQRTNQISIIIPTFQSPQLDQTLQAIAQLDELNLVKEVLVVGQQDAIEIPTLPGFRYIEVNENPTPARNRNAGARAAKSEWVCFTDSDCQPNKSWIREIHRSIQPDRVAIAGAVCIPRETPYWGVCDHLLAFEFQTVEIAQPGYVPYAATLNFCIRKDIFLALGGFDESFTTAGGEDRDFGWRLEKAGYTIENVPSALVLHKHLRHNLATAWQHIYHYGCVTAQFRLKHAKKNPKKWYFYRRMAYVPIIGETAGVLRAISRNLGRPLRQPSYRRLLKFIPGITLLDIAHTLGTIQTLRSMR
jgi:GT2 family glycosyltransferase